MMSCGGTTPTPPRTHPPTDCFAVVVSPFLLFLSQFLDSPLHGGPESLQSGTTFSSLTSRFSRKSEGGGDVQGQGVQKQNHPIKMVVCMVLSIQS